MKPPQGLVPSEHFKKFYNLAAGGDSIEILIYGRIGCCWWDDGVSAAGIAAILKEYPNVATINLRINSLGGSVFEGSAIYNQLARHPAKKIVDIDGVAASAASWIAMSGDERRMGLNGYFMIHEAAGETWGPAVEHERTAALLRKMNEQQLDVYGRVSNLSRDALRTAVAAETWYTADEALAAGFLTSTAKSDLLEQNGTRQRTAVPDQRDSHGFKNAPADLERFFSFGMPGLRFERPEDGDGFNAELRGLGIARSDTSDRDPLAAQQHRPPMVGAPASTTEPTLAPVPAAAANGDKRMNPKILKLLGLQDGATEAEIEAAIATKCQPPVAATEQVMQALGARTEQAALSRANELQAFVATMLSLTAASTMEQALAVANAHAGSAVREAKLAAQVSTLEKQVTDAKRDTVIAELSKSGKLPPSLHPWAQTQTGDQLKAWAAGVPDNLFDKRVQEPEGQAVALTDLELQIAKQLGIKPEVALANKKAQLERQAQRTNAA